MPETLPLERWGPRQTFALFAAALGIAVLSLAYDRPWVLSAVAAFLVMPVLVARPAWGLYPLMLIVTVIPPVGVVPLREYLLTIGDVYMIVLTVAWFAHKLATGAALKRSPLLVPIAIVVGVRFFSIFATPGLVLSGSISFLRYVEWLLVFVIVVDVARAKDAMRLLTLFLCVVGAQSLLTLAQASFSLASGQVKMLRGGTLGEVGNLLAWLQLYAVLLGISLAHCSKALWKRVFWRGFVIVVAIGLLSTLGRTAWITAVLAYVAYHWLDRSSSVGSKAARVAQDLALVVVSLGVLFALNQLLFGMAVLRAATLTVLGETFASIERLTLWRVGLEMFIQHPVLGVGTGNYADLLGQMVGPDQARTAHNAVVGILSETGLVGFVAYLFLVSRILAMVRADLRTHSRSSFYPFLLPLGSVIVALLFADWIGWASFTLWSMLFLGLYVVITREAAANGRHEQSDDPDLLPRERR